MSQYDVIVVGGGISGMAMAHFAAKEGFKPLVLEKENRLGGSFNSFRTDGFWFELGAHSCYNSYGNLITLLADIGCLQKVVKPGSAGYKLFTKDGIKSIMSQMSFAELLVSLPRMFGAKMEGETVESYYSNVVGKNNFRRAVGPMFNAVICQDAADFPADMLFKKRERRKDVIKKFSLPGGVQTIIDTIADQPAVEMATGKEVREISCSSGVCMVKTADGATFEGKRIAVAAHSAAAAEMLKASFPELSEKLSKLKAEKVDTIGVVVRNEETKIPPIAALAASDDIFYSFVSRDTFPDPSYRGFAFHFKAGTGSREARLERISQVLGTRSFQQIATAGHVIPSLRLGHKEAIAEIDAVIAKTPILLTGNYFTGLAIEDCISRSLQESRRLKG